MDIIAKDVFQILNEKAPKVFEGSVIAGGSVVDSAMGVNPTDVDIFIPENQTQFINKLVSFEKKNSKEKLTKGQIAKQGYKAFSQLFDKNDGSWTMQTRSINWDTGQVKEEVVAPEYCFVEVPTSDYNNPNIRGIFKGKINGMGVDIIPFWNYRFWPVTHEVVEEEFIKLLMDSFDFGITQGYYNTEKGTVLSDACQYDMANHTATLIKLNHMSELPKAIRRFEKIEKKYPKINFRQDVFILKSQLEQLLDTNNVGSGKKKKSIFY